MVDIMAEDGDTSGGGKYWPGKKKGVGGFAGSDWA